MLCPSLQAAGTAVGKRQHGCRKCEGNLYPMEETPRNLPNLKTSTFICLQTAFILASALVTHAVAVYNKLVVDRNSEKDPFYWLLN